ncbi:TonB family protein [Maribacter sp. MMG018]|uniref:TonB family protein n=1 Tax=Maribacter sp. MMG018 TaxID=2822688 RepID=UPI001B38523D|nr:TonB family protein [Maribacter sp. MMG018]
MKLTIELMINALQINYMKYLHLSNFNISKVLIFIAFCLFNIFGSQSMEPIVAQDSKEYYKEAETAFESGNYDNSIIYANKAKNLLGRTNPKIESLLMQAYYKNGDIVKAKIAYETFLKVTPPQKQSSELFESYKKTGALIDSAFNELERKYQQQKIDKQKEVENVAIGNEKKQRQKDNDKQEDLKTKKENLERRLFLKAKKSIDPVVLKAYKENFPNSYFSEKTQDLIDILDVKDDLPLAENREASFRGGSANFYKWLSHYIIYPLKARQMGVEGTVHVSFTVLKDGNISAIEISEGASYFKEEVIRVMNMSPKWIPAKKNDEFVEERKTIAIDFKFG